jgi:hypothetical protein
MFEILILFFGYLKSTSIKKKDINDLQTKLEYLEKLVKKIAILINPPFKIFRKKKLFLISCIFSQKIQQKSFFRRIIIFEILIRKKCFRRHIGFIFNF